MRTALLVLAAVLATACSHWQAYDIPGETRELARHPVGSPHLVETTDLHLAGGFLSTHEHEDGVGVTRGFGDAQGGSVKQTFCAQTTRIDYEQPVRTEYREFGHVLDYAGGATLLVGGLFLAAMNQNDIAFHQEHFSDPFFADTAPSSAPTAIGVVAALAGVGLAIYSAVALPKGPKPVALPSMRKWTDEKLVEVQGCRLPGAPVASPKDESPAAQKLEELKRLHDQGILNDREYEQKRKAALDQL